MKASSWSAVWRAGWPPSRRKVTSMGGLMPAMLPVQQLDGVTLADAGELALVAMGEDLAAAARLRPLLPLALGLRLGRVRTDDIAVLDLRVPALAVRDDVDVRHPSSVPPGHTIRTAVSRRARPT